MIISVDEIIENKDGSATLQLSLDEDGKRLLIERGVTAILEDYIDKVEEDKYNDMIDAINKEKRQKWNDCENRCVDGCRGECEW